MRHRLAIASALLLALAGCSDDSPAPKTSPTTTPTNASPTPTGLVAPVLPNAADAKTKVGAKAFVNYWFEAVTYAMRSGDTGPASRVAETGCETCAGLSKRIAAIYEAGNRNEGGGWLVSSTTYDPRVTGGLKMRFEAVVDQPPQTLVNASGKVLDRDQHIRYVFFVTVTWSGHWRVHEVEKVA